MIPARYASARPPRPSVQADMPLDTLEKLSAAQNYQRWVFELCRPFLGQRLLEIGSGIGNLTGLFLEHGPVLATDLEPKHLARLQSRYRGRPNLATAVWDVTETPPARVRRFGADAVACLNLLEHVRDDAGVLLRLRELLPPGGRLILFVPALPAIYGTLDEELAHLRRYRLPDLLRLAQQAGLVTQAARYVNFPGIFGWWLNSRVLRRRYFSSRQVGLYDRIVPLLAWLEKIIAPPAGQSLFYAGLKPRED